MDAESGSKVPSWLWVLVVAVLVCGIFFRFYNIDRKFYWFDEAISSHIISGYTHWEVMRALGNQVVSVRYLQGYHLPGDGKGILESFNVLAQDDPGQSLPYYLVAWFWVKIWTHWSGNIVLITRSLSAVISLFALPLIYWFSWELFRSRRASLIVVALLSVSPFHVLYAQEARVYSMWTVITLLSSASLLWALRVKKNISWAVYSISMTLGFYIHLSTLFVAVGHGIYVLVAGGFRAGQETKKFLLSTVVALIIFSPWLVFLVSKLKVFLVTISWTTTQASFESLLAAWRNGLSSVFFDLNLGAYQSMRVILPVSILLVFVGYCILFFYRNAPQYARIFVFAMMATNLLPFLILDLIFGGMHSTIPRYLIPFFICIQICVAYFFAENIKTAGVGRPSRWLAAFGVVLALGIASCAVSSQAVNWWNKYLMEQQPQIASVINNSSNPLLITGESVGNLWPLSYMLNPSARLLVIVDGSVPSIRESGDVFLYDPSGGLKDDFKAEYNLTAVDSYPTLWRVQRK